MALPACPRCNSELAYQDGQMYVCPECAHEWGLTSPSVSSPIVSDEPERGVRDSNSS